MGTQKIASPLFSYFKNDYIKNNKKTVGGLIVALSISFMAMYVVYVLLATAIESYKTIMKTRWDFDKDEPIENASALCYALRKNVNMVPERFEEVKNIIADKKRAIIFYNLDCELEALKNLNIVINDEAVEVAEWNGHKHQPIPDSKYWIYLVQYNAGSEGWNCIDTDTIIFFSQNYSYRTMIQAAGRIDRLNTPFKDLYFYHLKTKSDIDMGISRALKNKKKFNETKFIATKTR